jgi:hypothetical protein
MPREAEEGEGAGSGCFDGCGLRELAGEEDAADEEVERSEGGVSSNILDMALVVEATEEVGDAGDHGLGAAEDHRPLAAAELFAPDEADDELQQACAEGPDAEDGDRVDRVLEDGEADAEGGGDAEQGVDDLRGARGAGLAEGFEVVHGAGDVPERIEEEENGGEHGLPHRGGDDECGPGT